LDCGAQEGAVWTAINRKRPLESQRYVGWNGTTNAPERHAERPFRRSGRLEHNAPLRGWVLSVRNRLIRAGASHQWMPVPRRGTPGPGSSGHLVVLTPNISTPFTIFQLLTGRMPSSGPHPIRTSWSRARARPGCPMFRYRHGSLDLSYAHMVVFSFRVLRRYLKIAGFSTVRGFAFGLYPFPNFMQPLLEALDPYHCHQMVMIARK